MTAYKTISSAYHGARSLEEGITRPEFSEYQKARIHIPRILRKLR